MKEITSPYYYTVERLKPHGKKLDVWESDAWRGYAVRVGGTIAAIPDKEQVNKRIDAAIAFYKKKYPGILSLEEVKQ